MKIEEQKIFEEDKESDEENAYDLFQIHKSKLNSLHKIDKSSLCPPLIDEEEKAFEHLTKIARKSDPNKKYGVLKAFQLEPYQEFMSQELKDEY